MLQQTRRSLLENRRGARLHFRAAEMKEKPARAQKRDRRADHHASGHADVAQRCRIAALAVALRREHQTKKQREPAERSRADPPIKRHWMRLHVTELLTQNGWRGTERDRFLSDEIASRNERNAMFVSQSGRSACESGSSDFVCTISNAAAAVPATSSTSRDFADDRGGSSLSDAGAMAAGGAGGGTIFGAMHAAKRTSALFMDRVGRSR